MAVKHQSSFSTLLLFGLIGLQIIGCTSQIDHVNKAEESILKAEQAFNDGRMNDYEIENARAEEHRHETMLAPWRDNYCNSFFWKEASNDTLSDILAFRKILFQYMAVGQTNGMIELYKHNFHWIDQLKHQKEEMALRHCSPSAAGFLRPNTIAKYDAAMDEAFNYYKSKTGRNLLDDVAKREHQEYESRRQNTWDLMSPEEKKQAAGFNPAVQACLEAALANNPVVDGVGSIVYDAAKLCENGLKQ